MDQSIADLKKALDQVAFLKTLEEKTKVPKLYIFAAAAAVVFFLLFANIFAGILSDIIALMYPAYASFKALESPGHDDDKKWLTYWVVVALFTTAENFVAMILTWLPAYYAIKVAFLIALVHPQLNLAEKIYDSAVAPFLRKHMGKIDGTVERGTAAVENAKNSGKKAAADAEKDD